MPPERRLVARALGHRRQRRRRLRPAVRRPRLEPPLQGRRRVHPARAPAARRPPTSTRRPPAAHLGQRRTGAGRHHRRPAVPLRRAGRGPVPADHAGARGRHPHRHAGRAIGGRGPGDVVEVEVDAPTAAGASSTGRLATTVVAASAARSRAVRRAADGGPTGSAARRRARATARRDARAVRCSTDELRAELGSRRRRHPQRAAAQARLHAHVRSTACAPRSRTRSIVGVARTLRYLPLREDLFAQHGRRHQRAEARDRAAAARATCSSSRPAATPTPGTLGDILALRAQVRGAAGIVTDGGVRDAPPSPHSTCPSTTAARHPSVLGRRHVPWDTACPIACGGAARAARRRHRRRRATACVVVPPDLAEDLRSPTAGSRKPRRLHHRAGARRARRRRPVPPRTRRGAAVRAVAQQHGSRKETRMKFRSDPPPSAARSRPSSPRSPTTARSTTTACATWCAGRWIRARTASRIGGSTGEPSAQTIDERPPPMRTAVEEIGDRVPFLPGTGSAKLDETLELTGRRHDAGRRRRADHHPVLRPPHPGGALPSGTRTVARGVPGPADRRLQRAQSAPRSTSRPRRWRACTGRATTSSASRRPPRTSSTSPACCTACGRDLLVWSGIELLCLPLLALGGTGFVSRRRPTSPRGPWRGCTSSRSSGDFDGGARHPLRACTRSSTCSSSRPTRRRRSGSSPSGGCIALRPRPAAAHLAHRRGPGGRSARCSPRASATSTRQPSRSQARNQDARQVSTATTPTAARPTIRHWIPAVATTSTAPSRRRRDLRRRRPGVQHGLRAGRARRCAADVDRAVDGRPGRASRRPVAAMPPGRAPAS